MIRRVLKIIRNRLDERSTWRGIVALATLVGVSLTPDQQSAVIAAGVAIGAALEAFLPDPGGRMHAPKPDPEPDPEPERLRAAASVSSERAADADSRSTYERTVEHWGID